MRLALYRPEIPQNTGTLMRLCACLGIPLDIVEPCGFSLADRNMKRAAMDYMYSLDLTRHENWDAFRTARAGRRLILLTTKAETSFLDFAFEPDDILLTGQESAGAPEEVHAAVHARVRIPMIPAVRSLNLAVAAAMVLSEALRQAGLYPKTAP